MSKLELIVELTKLEKIKQKNILEEKLKQQEY